MLTKVQSLKSFRLKEHLFNSAKLNLESKKDPNSAKGLINLS